MTPGRRERLLSGRQAGLAYGRCWPLSDCQPSSSVSDLSTASCVALDGMANDRDRVNLDQVLGIGQRRYPHTSTSAGL